jgi:1-acyl-sn-glycerol-3-phosphate acyltransferase
MILLDRSAGRQALRQMIEEARSAVAEGRKVLIFPQGTRQAVDEPSKYIWAGVYALYSNLNLPVLPAAHNSGLFWGKKTLVMDSGTVTVSYLPVIPTGLNRQEFQERVERLIVEEAKALLAENARA